MATTSIAVRVAHGVLSLVATFTAQNDATVFEMPRVMAMSLQGSGTFGAATLDIQASNDGVTYAALPTAVSLSAAGIRSVAVADLGFRYYRVIVLAAAPTGTLTATVIGMESR